MTEHLRSAHRRLSARRALRRHSAIAAKHHQPRLTGHTGVKFAPPDPFSPENQNVSGMHAGEEHSAAMVGRLTSATNPSVPSYTGGC